uniref:Reverse transcriptase Ty1/copia-type domain-containing protein n=1 Tax=Lactuca sativa TaxID=4236 RepID=A0A9R1VLI7_LACSA|nr:hypothetical protein LSAT_V11C500291250 [Lactuca sativa]
MLNPSGQPNNLWGEALLTSCYVHNRINGRVIPTSPYVLWKGRNPNLDYLKDDENSSYTTSTSTSQEILPHPPIVEEPRRITRDRIEKSFGDGFYSHLVKGTQKKVTREVIFAINLDDDPKTFTEAMTSKDATLWKEAIDDEMNSIMVNGTWELVDLPKERRPIGSKWLFKRKYHPVGSIFAYKARLVTNGYR